MRRLVAPFAVAALAVAGLFAASSATAAQPSTHTYDITTLAGKVASLRGTAGLQIRFSSFIEQEAQDSAAPPTATPITPPFVLSSPLDGTSVQAPNVTVNQDTAGAPQNETAIAVDPNNPMRIVAGANDYVSRTWDCTIDGTPCSALGDGYSGTYYSNDGGGVWCCEATGPGHLGTLIPGVTRLAGGKYDAAGDPSVTFDSRGHVYYAGLGFDRTSPPNTVAVNRGTFDSANRLSWGPPTFVNQTTAPSTLNDKEWIVADSHPDSPYRDRVYLTWTRFIFNAHTGAYVQSPIFFVSSSDGGKTFTSPKSISSNVLYGQGSRPVVGPDGTLYVFWDGSTRLASLNSTYMVRSSDGGATWSKPVAVSTLNESNELADTVFRVNSFPAAAVAPNGDLYATWTTMIGGASTAVWSTSSDRGRTWSAPQRVFPAGHRTAVGYPAANPDKSTLQAPKPIGWVEDIFPAVSVGPDGHVVFGAYRGDVVSPWQTCADEPAPPVGRIACDALGNYINNTRLDYVVTNGSTSHTVSTHPINTRNGFGGGFFGDYTDLAVGSDGIYHAFWTDSNNKQTVTWFYGVEFSPTSINQEDVVHGSGHF